MAESDLGGILGSKDMQDLLAQFQPSDADRKAARSAAMWSMGAGILGTPGGLGHALGVGAAAALPAYYSTLQQEQGRRLQNVQALSALYPMLLRDQFMKAGQQYLAGGQPPPSVQGQLPPAPAPVVPTAGMAPSTAAQFGPAPPPPANLAASNVQPAPMQVPQGTPPQSVAGFPQIDPRTQNPAAVAAAFMSADPKVVADTLTKLGTANVNRGLVTAPNGMPIARITEHGIQVFDTAGHPGQFFSYGPDEATAAAQRTAIVEGTKTAAVESAKLPSQEALERYRAGFQTVPVPVSGGGTMPVPLMSFLGQQAPGGAPSAPQSAAPQPAGGAPPTTTALPGPVPGTTVSPNVRPDQMDAIRRDAAAQGIGQQPPPKSYQGSIPIVARPPNVIGTPQSTEEATVAAGLAKQTLDDLAHYNDMGERAADIKGRLQLMEGLGEQVNAGVFEPAITQFGRILVSFGRTPDEVQELLHSSPSAAEAFNKLAIQTASEGLRQSLQGAGRYTQMEWQKFLEAYPNLGMTPQGRRVASQIMIGTTNYALAKQEAAQDYFNTNKTLNGFGTWFNKTNQAASFLPDIDQAKALMGAPSTAAAPLQPSAASVAHLRQHPELRGTFDQTYGAGSAAKVLGQ